MLASLILPAPLIPVQNHKYRKVVSFQQWIVGAGLKAKLETKVTQEVTRKAFSKWDLQVSASFPCDVREEGPMSDQGYSTSHVGAESQTSSSQGQKGAFFGGKPKRIFSKWQLNSWPLTNSEAVSTFGH